MISQTICRLCGNNNIPIIWDFGKSPLANAFKNKEDLNKKESEFPLRYFKCSNCHSVQLKDEVSSDILFKEYLYESPPNLIPHFSEMSKTTHAFLQLKDECQVLDIGSNTGLLLKEYAKLNCKISGIEPAKNIAEKARQNGVPTFNEFFNKGFAQYLRAEIFYPDLITCTNCFAHIPNLNEFVESMSMIMYNRSYFVFENAYLLNTIKNKDFGQAYFEHFFMHSLYPLKLLFEKYNLELFHVEYNTVQMGSVRGYVRKKVNRKITLENDSVLEGIEKEKLFGLYDDSIYQNFIKEIDSIKTSLVNKLVDLRNKNQTVSVYGWPAKMTLLNKYFDIEKYIDYIVEESNVKVGKFAPGTKLEIKSVDHFKNSPTDCCLLGAYNFEKDIKNKHDWYKGTWINPLS